jgi:tetratricopeptide (TPR) repeat protein
MTGRGSHLSVTVRLPTPRRLRANSRTRYTPRRRSNTCCQIGPRDRDSRGTWGIVRAELYWLAGDPVPARRYADSARVAYETQLRATPNDNQRQLFRGLALAYLGQRAAAVRVGERGLALAQATGDGYVNIPYARYLLARIYVAAGDHPHALDQLDSLLAKPYIISPAWLRIDPNWAPLRGDPRFERLIAQSAAGARPTP